MKDNYIVKLMLKNELMSEDKFLYKNTLMLDMDKVHTLIETLDLTFIRDEVIIAIRDTYPNSQPCYWLTVGDYNQMIKSTKREKKFNIISEHFGRADRTVEIVQLSDSDISVYHIDGEAIIFPSIYEMFEYHKTGSNAIQRFYCDEAQLDFVYSNFKDYYDIVNNFDIKNTKRKENGK